MLTTLARAFRVPDLRRKLLFTLAVIVLFRFGQVLPAPGVNVAAVRQCLGGARTGLVDMLQLFSGGAMLKLSVFALGVMPYITASIMIQMLAVVVPRLEALKKEGQRGQAKITQYTRCLTVGLAVLHATTVVSLARAGRIFPTCDRQLLYGQGLPAVTVIVITLVAGACLVMRLGS
nr:hypothetical protein GCM10020093_035750 [Planobispora longispora]